MTISKRHLTSAALALAGALVLTACGGGNDTATSDSGSSTGGMNHGSSSDSAAPSDGASDSAMGNDADVAFLTGMKPHHEQAVEMSDMVLAADPPAPVAELAEQVKAAQGPEIEQMDQMLADLGVGEDSGGHSAGGHGGMMSDADMQMLMDATGTEAARMYLEGMIEHHNGAIDAAETEIANGKYAPAVELAEKIAQDQAAEITKMEGLLASL
jgi:uncharacterized protein (DUF305 family)